MMATCKDCLHYEVCVRFDRIVDFPVDDGVCLEFEYKTKYVEQKRGRWVRYPHGSGIYCSECKRKRRYKDERDNYCPNCGAKMDKES